MHEGGLHKGAWFLVCSGALVNERTVVVAAHCVTDLGKVTTIKTADLKVVLGKFYRDDERDEKTIQNLRVREGFLGNWSFDLTSCEHRGAGPVSAPSLQHVSIRSKA